MIEWTDATWNPVAGCSIVSPGCTNCYAMRMAARIEAIDEKYRRVTQYRGLTKRVNGNPVWTGKVAVAWHNIDVPIRWRKPRRIFVNSMSDLFHEGLPITEIATIYGTAIAAVHLRKHTLQILTKRADRMRELLHNEEFWEIANATAESLVLEHTDPLNRRRDDARATCEDYWPDKPPPGIWLGVSAERQQEAEQRIPHLLGTPAAKRFISAEPLLGPLRLDRLIRETEHGAYVDDSLTGFRSSGIGGSHGSRLDWVITGGESGPGARPMHPDWVRSLRDQCDGANVPFFFKQWGEYLPVGQILPGFGKVHGATAVKPGRMKLHYGGTAKQAPKHAFAEHGVEFATAAKGGLTFRVGKKRAGAVLDGYEHREMPR
ncbi:MAG: phage Gp37/Gp68 family protein [Proteobacteria bacterium]|nr:phage Gp37/Gp68 family protein [Pseudomonadota bacterium]